MEKLPKLGCRVGRDSPAQIDFDTFFQKGKSCPNLGNVLKKGCFWDSFPYGGGDCDLDFSTSVYI